MKRGTVKAACLAMGATALVLAGPVQARSHGSIQDLVGVRASSGERELRDRGYSHVTNEVTKHHNYSYWYKSSKDRCIEVDTRDGRYAAIVEVASGECKRKSSHGSNAGAAVAVGAAALLIAAAAASHKSDHHQSGHDKPVDVSDLHGKDGIWADDELRGRGFTNVDTMTSGDTIYGIWYNGATGQCLQETIADSRVYDIRDIQTHPKCHS